MRTKIKSQFLIILIALLSAMKLVAQTGSNETNSQSNLQSQVKKRTFSFGFFAPLNQHLEFNYEQVVSNQISVQGTFGIIGPGVSNDERNPAGVFIRIGPRFYYSPDYWIDGMRRYNNLQGGYFQPQLIINDYSADENIYADYFGSSSDRERQNHLAVALMLNFGKQWVVANAVSLDTHIGFGYGAGGSDNGNQYSHVGGMEGTAFTLQGGIAIGFLTK